jgi:hypothetical protein
MSIATSRQQRSLQGVVLFSLSGAEAGRGPVIQISEKESHTCPENANLIPNLDFRYLLNV